MSSYHINPTTGNPGICRAKKKCRFGDITGQHYGSADQAREAYELKMKEKQIDKNLELEINRILEKSEKGKSGTFDSLCEVLKTARKYSETYSSSKWHNDYYGTVCHHISPVVGRIRAQVYHNNGNPDEFLKDELRSLHRALAVIRNPLDPLSESKQ
jgi:hypothetical protein